MPELPDRDDLEARVAALMRRVNAHQRDVLLTYLGWPPDARRIPRKLLAEMEQQVEGAMYGVLALMFMQSAEQLQDRLGYSMREDSLTRAGHEWAKNQARFVAQSTVQTKLGKVVSSIEELASGTPAIGSSGVFTVTPGISQPDWEQLIVDAFNDANANVIASTEATQAATAGEKEVASDFNKSTGKILEAFWRHRKAKNARHPCVKVCQPLENQPSYRWPEIHPTMPWVWNGPPAHPNCDCELEWIELTPAQAAAFGIIGG